jgi:hypothetical protein
MNSVDSLNSIYQLILEKRVDTDPSSTESFERFLDKRLAGAEKLAESTKAKGGYSTLTAIHYAAKAKPYAECIKLNSQHKEDQEKVNELYKQKAEDVYSKLSDLDSLSQKEFQALMGELEVYGEVYIRATKPESLKI